MNHHVVILGCPRSGTSILGELFEFRPECNYYFEPSTDWLATSGQAWVVKNPIDSIDIGRSPGLSCNLGRLSERLPNAKYLWIVRYPLDAICSLKPGLTHGWHHPPEPPDWQDLMSEPVHVRAAKMWRWVNGTGMTSLLQADIQPLVVRYEDLVSWPELTVRSILKFVDYEEDVDMSLYCERVLDTPGGYEAKHQVRWKRNDHEVRVGRWAKNLTGQEVVDVLPIVEDVSKRLGY